MSSLDSSLLAGTSYIYHNLYRQIILDPESDENRILVFRASVVILGILSTLISLSTSTIYGLWVLAGDLGYAIVFPQFLAAVHFR